MRIPLPKYFFEVYPCTDAEISFYSKGNTTVTAKKGDVVFIPKGSLYHVRVDCEEHVKIDTYTVNVKMYDRNEEEVYPDTKISVIASRQDNLLAIHLKNLNDAFHTAIDGEVGEKRNLAKINGEFYTLLDLISEAASKNSGFEYPIRKGIKVFCDEWNKNERIEKYAEICGVSVTYFYRCFRKWSGYSPVEYRNMLRLSNAERLLRCTDMQIKEISEAVGYDDPFYFCRAFSQRQGVSPQRYRKEFQKKV